MTEFGRLKPIIAALALAGCARAAPSLPAPTAGYDLVIEGGKVVDGTGSAWFYGDVAIRGDRIARVAPAGTLREAPAARRIDARCLPMARP